MKEFRDSTGREGPSSWQFGTFQKDQADFPVAGISWFEAAAYCEFVGKSLPTIYHWQKAAGFGLFSDILLFSNFTHTGPMRVGSNSGITPAGAYDMAGNVKAEHAVDLDTGAVVAVTLREADKGDTTTLDRTLCEAGEAVAELVGREAVLHPDVKPKVNIKGIEEMVADKGYHSGAALERIRNYQVRSYIPERQQKGQRKWEGKAGQQQAVYANRRRVQGHYGKSLLRRRGELVERSFAHCYDTGGMRRTHLRKHDNILKRQLIHVAGFNLSLIFRRLLGAGTPREWNNRAKMLLLFLLGLLTRRQEHNRRCRSMILRSGTAPAYAISFTARSKSCRHSLHTPRAVRTILAGFDRTMVVYWSWQSTRLGIEALYRKPNTSKPAPGHKIYPYPLRGLAITRPDQVWAMDISYIPIARGFVYLAAVIDSRRVL